MKKIITISIVSIIVSLALGADSPYTLQIHMPRQIKINTPTPSLGQVTILNGPDKIIEMASAIPMGRVTLADQQIVIDRPTILSRLASNNIPASNVKFTGAESVAIGMNNTVIDSDSFLQTAQNRIKTVAEKNNISNWSVLRYPEDLILGKQYSNISLKTELNQINQPNIIRVTVGAFVEQEKLGQRTIDFRVKYKAQQIIAAVDISKDTAITNKNIILEAGESDFPQPADWTPPYGLIAKRDIAKGTAIINNMLIEPTPEIIVKRNQNVVIKIEYSALSVTAIGKALQDGVTGEIIKVQNIDSKRIILGKINNDGSVEPVF